MSDTLKPMTAEEFSRVVFCSPSDLKDRIALALREREQLRCFVVEVRNSMKMRLKDGIVPRVVDQGLLDEANRLLRGAVDEQPTPR